MASRATLQRRRRRGRRPPPRSCPPPAPRMRGPGRHDPRRLIVVGRRASRRPLVRSTLTGMGNPHSSPRLPSTRQSRSHSIRRGSGRSRQVSGDLNGWPMRFLTGTRDTTRIQLVGNPPRAPASRHQFKDLPHDGSFRLGDPTLDIQPLRTPGQRVRQGHLDIVVAKERAPGNVTRACLPRQGVVRALAGPLAFHCDDGSLIQEALPQVPEGGHERGVKYGVALNRSMRNRPDWQSTGVTLDARQVRVYEECGSSPSSFPSWVSVHGA